MTFLARIEKIHFKYKNLHPFYMNTFFGKEQDLLGKAMASTSLFHFDITKDTVGIVSLI